MFGGIQEITRELNDVIMYDIKKNRWVLLFAEKAAESPMMLVGSPSPNKTATSAALANTTSPYGRTGTLLKSGQNSALKETKPARKNHFDTTA